MRQVSKKEAVIIVAKLLNNKTGLSAKYSSLQHSIVTENISSLDTVILSNLLLALTKGEYVIKSENRK